MMHIINKKAYAIELFLFILGVASVSYNMFAIVFFEYQWYLNLIFITFCLLIIYNIRNNLCEIRKFHAIHKYNKAHAVELQQYMAERAKFIRVAQNVPYENKSDVGMYTATTHDDSDLVVAYYKYKKQISMYNCMIKTIDQVTYDDGGVRIINGVEMNLYVPVNTTRPVEYDTAPYTFTDDPSKTVQQILSDIFAEMKVRRENEKLSKKAQEDMGLGGVNSFPDVTILRDMRLAIEATLP